MKRPITDAIKKMAGEYYAAVEQPTAVMMSLSTATALYDEWKDEDLRLQPFVMAKDGKVSMIYTAFGSLAILSSPYCPSDKIYVGEAEKLQAMADKTAEMYKGRS